MCSFGWEEGEGWADCSHSRLAAELEPWPPQGAQRRPVCAKDMQNNGFWSRNISKLGMMEPFDFFSPLTPQPSEKFSHLSPKKSFHRLTGHSPDSDETEWPAGSGVKPWAFPEDVCCTGGRQCDNLEKTHR